MASVTDVEWAYLSLRMWLTAHESRKRLRKFVKQLRKKLKKTQRSEWDLVVSELVEEYSKKYGYTEESLLFIARQVASELEKGGRR
jgi:DNA-binding transcriptional regulator YhcF (GntR family)